MGTESMTAQFSVRRAVFTPLITALFFSVAACSSSSGSDGPGSGGSGGGGGDGETYSVGGQADNIGPGDLVLALNAGDTLTLDEDGLFQFETELSDGEAYAVTIEESSDHYLCEASNHEGVIGGGDVDDVQVNCEYLAVRAELGDRAVHLEWDRTEAVTVFYSTDPACDWVNYSQCPDYGFVDDAEGGSLTITENDGLVLGEVYAFVITSHGQYSRPESALISAYGLTGAVHDVAISEEFFYAGGGFQLYGEVSDGVAQFNPDGDGSRVSGIPLKFDGNPLGSQMFAVEKDPRGGWFVAGQFSGLNGKPVNRLARLNSDGTVDAAWSVFDITGRVDSLLVHDEQLFLGGNFNISHDGHTRSRLAALDLDGNLLPAFDPLVPDETVRAMAVHDGTLFVGGDFSEMGVESRQYIAAVDVGTGELSDTFAPVLDGSVYDLLWANDRLYIAGAMDEVNGQVTKGLAAVDPENGDRITEFDPQLSARSRALVLLDDVLLVGGGFTNVAGDTSVQRLAALDLDSGALNDLSGSLPSLSGEVRALDYSHGWVYVGGTFSTADGLRAFNTGRIDALSGEWDGSWTPRVDASSVEAVVATENRVIFGGSISGGGGHVADNLVRIDRMNGAVDEEWEVGTFREINSVISHGDTLYLGGRFTQVISGEDRVTRVRSAAVDRFSGDLLGWQPQQGSTIEDMYLDSDNGAMYLVGYFTAVDGEARNHLAVVDLLDGDNLVGSGDPGIEDAVFSVTVDEVDGGDQVIIGGAFDGIDGNAGYGGFAYVDPDSLYVNPNQHPRQSGLYSNGTIRAVQYLGTISFFWGGDFTQVSGEDQQYLALIGWDAGAQEYVASGPEPSSTVRAMDFYDTDALLYVGGDFDAIDGEPRNHFAILDLPDSASLVGSTPGFDGRVQYIKRHDDELIIGGRFRHMNDDFMPAIVILDVDSLEPVW